MSAKLMHACPLHRWTRDLVRPGTVSAATRSTPISINPCRAFSGCRLLHSALYGIMHLWIGEKSGRRGYEEGETTMFTMMREVAVCWILRSEKREASQGQKEVQRLYGRKAVSGVKGVMIVSVSFIDGRHWWPLWMECLSVFEPSSNIWPTMNYALLRLYSLLPPKKCLYVHEYTKYVHGKNVYLRLVSVLLRRYSRDERSQLITSHIDIKWPGGGGGGGGLGGGGGEGGG